MTEHPTPSPEQPRPGATDEEALGRRIAASYGASGTMRRGADGQIDVMHAVGGVRGILEAVLPSAVFLVAFLATGSVVVAAGVAVGLALAAALVRLAQRGRLLQSFSGAAGVVVCALFARVGGHAVDYYLPGLWINAAYGAAVALSMLLRWPAVGLLFGFLRGEDVSWRRNPARLRAYQWATGLVLALFLARLAVQVPLYLADAVTALGAARIVMGTPFYALVLWLSWLISRRQDAAVPTDGSAVPQAEGPDAGSDAEGPAA